MGLSNYLPNSRISQAGVVPNEAARPTSPYTGQVIYQLDTLRTLVWNGVAWVDLSTGKTGQSGLVLIEQKSVISGSGLVFDNVFTSTFRMYRVTYSFTQTTNNNLSLRMRLNGVNADGATDYAWTRATMSGTSAPSNNGGSTGASSGRLASGSSTGSMSGSYDVSQPAIAEYTNWFGLGSYSTITEWGYSTHKVATAYDGFEVYGGSGLTGAIFVYGYNQ
jgi:hypothetical protein